MKKRTEKNTAKRKSIFNKLGMTYIELICALALLSLIVVMFTPMLLSSYEQLYNAGEKVAEIYDSKTDLEKGLARRNSTVGVDFNMTLSVKKNVAVNADLLFQNINVKGRKIVASLNSPFETVYSQMRPTLTLISPAHVNDDSTSHDILIQTRGLEFNEVKDGIFSDNYDLEPEEDNRKLPKKTIFIEVVLPDKTEGGGGNNNSGGNVVSTEEKAVYNGNKEGYYCDVEVLTNATDSDSDSSDAATVGLGTAGGLGTNNSNTAAVSNLTDDGKLALRISNSKLDFTFSPLKINVYYVNTRGKTRMVSDYIYIDPPTIMFAGETSEADYYTSAGVKEITDDSQNAEGDLVNASKYILEFEKRTMRTENSPYLTRKGDFTYTVLGSPSSRGIEIKNIRWIDNDRTAGIKPYYVMTGTKGSIYRMYNFTSENADLYKYSVAGASKDTSTGYFNTTTGTAIDKVYNISTGEKICPALWSGDSTFVFEYTSAIKRVAYGESANFNKDKILADNKGDFTWVTSVDRKGVVGDAKYNVFNTQAEYAYYYNGSGTNHGFLFKNSRPISYVITERGWPLRLFGVVGNNGDGFRDFTQVWDSSVYLELDGLSPALWWKRDETEKVFAFYGVLDTLKDELQEDYVLSSLRIKAMASYNSIKLTPPNDDVKKAVDLWDTAADYESTNSMSKLRTVRRGQGHPNEDRLEGLGSNINITDVVYIPNADDDGGTTFYVGNVNAFANVLQTDRIDSSYVDDTGTGKNFDKSKYYKFGQTHSNFLRGAVTDYLIYGTDDGRGTYIAKYNDNDFARGTADERKGIMGIMTDYIENHKYGPAPEDKDVYPTGSTLDVRNKFFYPDRTNVDWKYIYLPAVEFTFGFVSNRERVYTNITYNGKKEFMRSFERLYWRSHYGQDIEENSDVQAGYNGALLKAHTQNKSLNKDTALVKGGSLNTKENDYYNVWFPGEMYNLTKVASKDGVSVAVGFSVVGSAYQYAHNATFDGGYKYTSTALGGIYNDGVLSAMVEGQDDAFLNLLYYKDNESFDDKSLWNSKAEDGKKGYTQYSDYGDTNYGMHTRDSVQFTAVDIFVEEKTTSVEGENEVNYWAIYGDSKGRAYMSIVATGTATATGSGDPDDENSNLEVTRDINLVSYISDGNAAHAAGCVVSDMQEIVTVDGYTLDVAFKKITSIEADDNLVVITGVRQTGLNEIIVVGQCKDGEWTWKWYHQKDEFKGDITDAAIVNGYYYFVGYEGVGHSFIGAISIDTLKNWPNAQMLKATEKPGMSYDKNEVIWAWTTESSKINTIAGRASS